jgi:hypothetical protein
MSVRCYCRRWHYHCSLDLSDGICCGATCSLLCTCPRRRLWGLRDDGRSGGAELPGELFAQFLVLAAQPRDLFSVGVDLLAERVGEARSADGRTPGRAVVASWSRSISRRSVGWR